MSSVHTKTKHKRQSYEQNGNRHDGNQQDGNQQDSVAKHNHLSTQAQEANEGFPVLSLKDFTVQRGDAPLCAGVTLLLNAGDICHLIGANGTGKTTLLMQLAGLLPVLNGHVFYQGKRCLPVAPLYVSHQLGINASLTVAQNLIFLLNLYGITPSKNEIGAALAWVDLAGFEHINSNELSAGQTRRVTLARLFLMTPEQTPLWLLDEPFTALDVNMVAKLQARLQQFVAVGGCVLMTSHQQVDVVTKQLNLSDFLWDDMEDLDKATFDIPDKTHSNADNHDDAGLQSNDLKNSDLPNNGVNVKGCNGNIVNAFTANVSLKGRV